MPGQGKKIGMNKKLKAILITAAALVLTCIVICACLYFGIIHINHPELKGYKVKGVDVSSYQGDIDWDVLSSQGIDFAYIKATEGSKTVDRCFEANWKGASFTSLRIGAYHFFSFESPGETQAELFRSTVKEVPGMLPPAVDVEFYGDFGSEKDIDVSAVKAELRVFVDSLAGEYCMKPVIYCDARSYDALVREGFDDCDIRFRSVYSKTPDGIGWTFWQYSNRHRLEGYSGRERYIDMNIFNGDAGAFAAYPGKEE